MADFLDKSNDLSFSPPAERDHTSFRPLVLVVEDHEDTRSLYRHVLESHGYEVAEAANGDEAIRLASELHPDLVLIDTNLPEMDGLTATRSMRRKVALHNLPIIFISGNTQPELRAAAFAAGGNDYLIKPMSISDLEESVDKHLARVGKSRGLSWVKQQSYRRSPR